MITIHSTLNIWYTNYKSRTFWIAFNTSSRIALTSTICCLSSSADLGISSRLLWMTLPSLTLASSSYFFCLMTSGIWVWLDLPDQWEISPSPVPSLVLHVWFPVGSALDRSWGRSSSNHWSVVSSLWPLACWSSSWTIRLHGWTDSSKPFSPLGFDLW